ncbi:Surfactin synthase thioesterase subunit [compost metagenome]
MGAIIAYELAQKIYCIKAPLPRHIILSGCVPPDKFHLSNIDLSSDDQIKQRILKMGGTPLQIVENPEFDSSFLPIIRADYLMLERYEFNKQEHLLSEDISVLYSKNDDSVSIKDVLTWGGITTGLTRYYEFEGNHFFLTEESKMVIECIRQICRDCRD